MKVASFYRFLDLAETGGFRDALFELCRDRGLLGTVLVAAEGVNGSLAGNETDIRAVFAWIEERLSLPQPIEARWNEVSEPPFRRMRVRLKKEIVTLGRPDIHARPLRVRSRAQSLHLVPRNQGRAETVTDGYLLALSRFSTKRKCGGGPS